MAGLNKVMIIGHLGADTEIRFTDTGLSIANFSVAVSNSWTGKDGQKQDSTEWFRVVAFGKLAEVCGQYLKKGKQVYIEGRLQTRKWEDKEGVTRYTTEVVANQMQMLGRKGDDEQSPPAQQYAGGGGDPAPPELDDIPF